MIKYKPRLTAADMPENGNKYYIRKADGGVNPSIKGSPTHSHLTVLSNCVGYVVGRTMEILQTDTPVFAQYNAEDFYSASKLEKGQVPKPGSVACWKQGKTWNGNDGAGHVAVVEKVISDTEIITSESAYGGMCFYTKTRKKGSGNWGAGGNFEFLGFIYLPEECIPIDDTTATPDDNVSNKPAELKIGDIVDFKGGLHYVASSSTTAVGGQRTAGKATITAIAKGTKHPYHLIGIKGGSNVYGWVDAGTFKALTSDIANKELSIGNKVMIKLGAFDLNTKQKFADWVYSRELYVREINGDRVVVSTQMSGAVTGAVNKDDLTII